ncbi:MAG: di-heme oxidoredictase family protein [Planctomycetota bacterium]
MFTESPELRQKWKTPPLWGVRDSAPYMHDGRAATLDEAIRLHAGEAKQVTQAYKALSGLEREQLLAFLNTLAAPMMPPVTSPL